MLLTRVWGFCAALFFTVVAISAVAEERAVALKTDTGTLHGTLLMPEVRGPVTAALIIAGSGPTDRNGNQPSLSNNSLKLLAEDLSREGVASLRFDKRGIAESRIAGLEEDRLGLETYVKDAEQWLKHLASTPRVSSVVIIGHSEGALIGTLVPRIRKSAGLVIIAGAGVRAAELLRVQLQNSELPRQLVKTANQIIDSLLAGRRVEDVDPRLMSILRPSVHYYLSSWFKYDPVAELSVIRVPVLVVQGTHDLQIDVTHPLKLKRAGPHVTVAWVADMNHVLKAAPRERMANFATYAQPQLPLAEGLIDTIVSFIHGLDR